MRNKRFKGNTDWYMNVFRQFEDRLNGDHDTAVHHIRKKAIEIFAAEGYPTTGDEDWKYTNIKPITEIDFATAGSPAEKSVNQRLLQKYDYDGLDCCQLIFVNGHFAPDLSNLNKTETGLKIFSIREALKNDDPILRQHLARYTAAGGDSFTALNTAFLWDGVFVYLPANHILERPVSIIYLGQSNETPTLNMPRSLFVLGKNSQASVIETYLGEGDQPYLTNTVSEVILEDNAGLEHFKIQVESELAYHVSTIHAEQQRGSRYTSHAFSFGGQLVRNNINLVLNAEGVASILNGLYVGTGRQLIDNHTSIDHARPHCHSEELYKGVLDDHAHGVFNGKIFVRPDAQKTNAIQSNNCILLSENAAVDTKPQLEIFADDVRCTHGATVGQLDDDAYFYMRSRGIDRTKARQLLIYAFASEVIDRIDSQPIRQRLSAILADKLHTVKPQ